jgi:hypothetical protein
MPIGFPFQEVFTDMAIRWLDTTPVSRILARSTQDIRSGKICAGYAQGKT